MITIRNKSLKNPFDHWAVQLHHFWNEDWLHLLLLYCCMNAGYLGQKILN